MARKLKTYLYYRQPLQDELDEFYRATGLMGSLPDDAKIENDDRSAVWTALLCGKSRRPGEVPSVHWMYTLSPCESTLQVGLRVEYYYWW